MFTYTRNEQKWFRKTTPQPPSQYQVPRSILFYILCGWFLTYEVAISFVIYFEYLSNSVLNLLSISTIESILALSDFDNLLKRLIA